MKQLILIISLMISNLCLGCFCCPAEMKAQIEAEAASPGLGLVREEISERPERLSLDQNKTKLAIIFAKRLDYHCPEAKLCLSKQLLGTEVIVEALLKVQKKREEFKALRTITAETGNKAIMVHINPEATVAELIKAISEQTGKNIHEITLFQEGVSLENHNLPIRVIEDNKVLLAPLFAPKEISYKVKDVIFEFVRVKQADGSFLYFGKYPVTQSQWIAIMGSNPSNFIRDTKRPVEQISYNDIVTRFLPRLNGEGKTYRLPTEQEWEYAARAGSKATWPWGEDEESRLGEFAWYKANVGWITHAVGDKDPNDFGLYDMLGNVWEWTSSPWSEGSSSRVIRGGSWYNSSRSLRPAFRRSRGPDYRNFDVGFRLVRTKP